MYPRLLSDETEHHSTLSQSFMTPTLAKPSLILPKLQSISKKLIRIHLASFLWVHAAFYDAFEDHRLHNQLRFVMPKTLIILNPPSYEFFKETREKRFRSITMDDFYPKGQEKEELWKDNWAVIDSWLKKNPTGDFVFGETITWADFVLAEWVIWYRILFGVDSEEWKDIASWHDGRLDKLLKKLSQYETVL
ncbi:hypothetical protein Moror_11123 [Moniliophthora roreri MCA 2997]|uniref:Glutathione S-transferase UstS-like C-terminal domain-containing protein n=2 Tax=Moniliophthora roreri TaxID=221103 RepID=V2XQ55_MONRO|nr:hypothetical protein Moror_11123 [Moniliophthora roreri MCA 2997]